MKQAFLLKGNVIAHNVPIPNARKGQILVHTHYSCISVGTEMSSVADSSKSLFIRAIEKPQTALKFLHIARTRGVGTMLSIIKGARGSDFGNPIGYTAAGVVVTSKAVHNQFKIGQKVAMVGTMYANHAEYNSVPENLLIPVPDAVSLEDAATAALGGIAMQGVRQLNPNINNTVLVMGLGFIGLLTVQMLVASGCKVIGVDIDRGRMEFTNKQYGIPTLHGADPLLIDKVNMLTNAKGVDGVIFTASTHSSVPMSNCFKMLRRKGTFVLVGVSGMSINREDIYKKELTFKIATSYGPGRYDTEYEEGGHDYPIEYVRFTEKRNIECYFNLIASGKISLLGITKQVWNIDEVSNAYQRLKEPNPPIISILDYTKQKVSNIGNKIQVTPPRKVSSKTIVVGYIGAGSYVKNMHLPNMQFLGDKYYVKGIMNRSAIPAAALATQFHAEYYTTDYEDIINDPEINLVMVCTRHDSHAYYVLKALTAGKNVFVEKPICLNEEELKQIMAAIKTSDKHIYVGYNRRFSEYALAIKRVLLKNQNPIHINYTMNAGYVPYDAWIHNDIGGGRIIGEGCHIIDLAQYLVGRKVVSVSVFPMCRNAYFKASDNMSILITYSEGSTALIKYISAGAKTYPKETMTITLHNGTIYLDDYKKLRGDRISIKRISTADSDKGQVNILKEVYRNLMYGEGQLIKEEELYDTSMITFIAANAAKTNSCAINVKIDSLC